MIPGEFYIKDGIVELNVNRKKLILIVMNNGDRPIQIGSHFHFYEVNTALRFNRNLTLGFRLNVPSGMSIRFEPGQTRKVELVQYSGKLEIFGFCKKIMGKLNK